MSKAKDRARAESGLIFRDGSYVNKEEWYAAHPTKEMIWAMRQPVEAVTKFSYFCSKCNHRHTEGSKICTEHRRYARTPVTLREEA